MKRDFLVLVALGCFGCPAGNEDSKIDLRLRADSVQPGMNVDVTYEIDGSPHEAKDLTPGSHIDLGRHASGTTIKFKVFNKNGSGQVRAHILADNCFRASSSCDSLNCIAEANYVAKKEECINY